MPIWSLLISLVKGQFSGVPQNCRPQTQRAYWRGVEVNGLEEGLKDRVGVEVNGLEEGLV